MKRAMAVCLFLLCATFGAAHADVPQASSFRAPISITSASVVPLPPAVTGENGVSYGYVGVDVLGVAFVNTSSVAAREVTLRATYAGDTRYIQDKGVFAPQVVIERYYHTFSKAEFHGDAVRVTVAAVRFADGTTWTAPPDSGTIKQS